MVNVSDVLGTWVLVNWTSLKNGEPAGFPMGEDAHGQIIYSAEGRMAASLMNQNFRDNPSTTNASPDVCLAYGGTFAVDGDEVVHDVIFATLPHWIGQPLIMRNAPKTIANPTDNATVRRKPCAYCLISSEPL